VTVSTGEQLADAQFVSLTTFRKDGTAVPTAVWVAAVPDGLGVWTVADSGKVKRIRRDGTVTVAVCDLRGTPTGPAVPAHARVLDADGTARVRTAVRRKYKLLGRVLTILSSLRRGDAGSVGIAITLD
jgi:hypothetical protein